MLDEINYPTGFGLKDIVSWGNSGLVCLDKYSQTIVKSPHAEENTDFIAIEKRIYERFGEHGGHQGVLSYYGSYESGIRLEYAPNHDLQSFLKKRTNNIDVRQRLRWATQLAESLGFVHCVGVIHGDLTSKNVFLDENLNAKLADYAGSSLDGSPLLVAVTASHRYPGLALSIKGDLFAFGSVLYEIMTGVAPYHTLSEADIYARYSKGEFPETKSLQAIGSIVRKCWQGRYDASDAVIRDLKGMFALNFILYN